ncbi:MAG: CAP domain-containing protein [Bdellovibrionota bacterium]
MRYVFCFLLLVWGCEKDSGTTVSETQIEASQPAPVENVDDIVIDVPLDPKTKMIEEFMDLINDHRISLGLSTLDHTDGLQEIAQGHSQNMASGNVAFGHTGFSTRCSLGRTVIGGGNLCAENVATGQKTVEAAFNAWMNSSGHRANIEQARVTHTGFGFAQSSSGVWYWTQIFLEKN